MFDIRFQSITYNILYDFCTPLSAKLFAHPVKFLPVLNKWMGLNINLY